MIQCNCKNKISKGSDYMTHTDYTKLILNIEDKNIFFYENRKFLFEFPVLIK